MTSQISIFPLQETIIKNMKWKNNFSKTDDNGRHVELNVQGAFDGIRFEITIMGHVKFSQSINFHCINENEDEGNYSDEFDRLTQEFKKIYNNIECYELTGKYCQNCNHELTRSETIGDKKYCNHCRNKRDK